MLAKKGTLKVGLCYRKSNRLILASTIDCGTVADACRTTLILANEDLHVRPTSRKQRTFASDLAVSEPCSNGAQTAGEAWQQLQLRYPLDCASTQEACEDGSQTAVRCAVPSAYRFCAAFKYSISVSRGRAAPYGNTVSKEELHSSEIRRC